MAKTWITCYLFELSRLGLFIPALLNSKAGSIVPSMCGTTQSKVYSIINLRHGSSLVFVFSVGLALHFSF